MSQSEAVRDDVRELLHNMSNNNISDVLIEFALSQRKKGMEEAAKLIEGNSCVRHCELCRTSPCGVAAAIEIRRAMTDDKT